MTALSSWWASSHHRAMGSERAQVVRLAIALGAIRSVVRVIDHSVPPMTVDWADTSISYTDFSTGELRINTAPIIDGTPDDEGLDVAVAFAMHEASHSEESRDRYEALLTRDAEGNESFDFSPMAVAVYLWNMVEDPRIEQATSRKWPGFAPYFPKMLDWLWRDMAKRSTIPDDYGSTLKEHLGFAFVACRYPAQAATRWPDDPERLWWQEWQDAYHDGSVDTKATIQAGLDHLARDAEPEMDEIAKREEVARELARNTRELLDHIAQDLDYRLGIPVPCAPAHASPDDAAVEWAITAQVRQLLNEELIEVPTIIGGTGSADMDCLVTRPLENADSRRAYVGRPDATSDALRAALVFRSAAPRWQEKLLRDGDLDDEELYRWAESDDRLFSQRVVESKPDALLGLLVDLSGSMMGRKLVIAQRLAQLFVYALHDQEGVTTRVWGHTANIEHEPSASVFRIWEPGDPLTRLGLITTLTHANNADGHAIAYCASAMRDEPQPEKALIVLSDGQPSATGRSGDYGGPPARLHMRRACAWAARQGVRVIQIAIDPGGLRPVEQEQMFGPGNWISYQGDAALPRQLASLMARLT